MLFRSLSEASGYFETLFSSKAVEDVALEIEFEEDSDREDEGDGAVEEPKPKRRKTAQLEVSGDQQLITIRGVSYNTFRALLVFYLSGHIEFAFVSSVNAFARYSPLTLNQPSRSSLRTRISQDVRSRPHRGLPSPFNCRCVLPSFVPARVARTP